MSFDNLTPVLVFFVAILVLGWLAPKLGINTWGARLPSAPSAPDDQDDSSADC